MRTPKILVATGVSWILAAVLLISCGGDSKKTYSITGTVSGAITAGVSISLSGAATATATTDGSGVYTVSGLANGSYTVTPSMAGYAFEPASLNVTVNGANLTGQNFTAIATYSISGTVSGAATAGVSISLSGAATATATTDGSGAYTVSGLASGSYTVTPSLTGYTFAPASLDVVVSNADVTGQNFVATKNASCDQICNKLATECNQQTGMAIADCTTLCQADTLVITNDAWGKTGDCILNTACSANLLTSCLTQVADTITNNNIATLEGKVCEKLVACALTTQDLCPTLIDTLLNAMGASSFVSLAKLATTTTIECVTNCFSNPQCNNIPGISDAVLALLTCTTTTCGIVFPG